MELLRACALIVILPLSALSGCSNDEAVQGPADHGAVSTASAAATLTPLAEVDDELPTLRGKATFNQTPSGVDLAIELKFCKDKRSYRLHIEAAPSCKQLTGEPWDGVRGQIVQRIPCYGGGGGTFDRRDREHPKPWTIGGAARTNVLGRVLVMSDSESKRAIACGEIEEVRGDDAGTAADVGNTDAGTQQPSLAIRAHIAGMCETELFVHSGSANCPDPEKLALCAKESCELDSCLAACRSYTECLESDTGDWCISTCERSEACWDCTASMFRCMFGPCERVLSCAAPAAPNGPCRKLEACCRMQNKGVEACLDLLEKTERLSGDPSCAGLLVDEAFLSDIVNDPRCDELDL